MHALLIEDDALVTQSIQLILKSEGYTCDATASGEAGLKVAQAKKHDIIILDLTLPDLEGHEVVRRLRAAWNKTPVLILSGSDDRHDKIKGLETGADDYVTKPFDKDELIARIHAIVRRAKGSAPSSKAAALDSVLLARRGAAAPWSFATAYAPPQEAGAPGGPRGQGARDIGRDLARRLAGAAAPPVSVDGAEPSPAPAVSGPERPAPDPAITDPTPRPTGPAMQMPSGTARIVVLGNAKGGTGKSTTAMHLIVALLTEGCKVGSLDLDPPQATLTRYIENRRACAAKKELALAMPEHHAIGSGAGESADFSGVLDRLSRSCDHIVIDTPGHDNALSRLAHACADTLITPINDSFLDLDVLALVETEPLRYVQPSHYSDMVMAAKRRKAEHGGGEIEWIVLRNRLSALDARNKRSMAKILTQLSERIGFRAGPGLSERVIYRELFLSGLTLLDLGAKETGVELTMSHVAARQELRMLLDLVGPARHPDKVAQPAQKKEDTRAAAR